MIKLYHGTTEEAYRSIMANGFRHDSVVWMCSDPDMLYFYQQDLVAGEYSLDEQGSVKKCFELALQSAFVSAASTESASCNLYVFEFLLGDELAEAVLPDKSTGLETRYSVCVDTKTLDTLPCNVYGAADSYAPRLALVFLAGIQEQEYLSKPDFSPLERMIAENVIAPVYDALQTELYDFWGQINPILLRENFRAA